MAFGRSHRFWWWTAAGTILASLILLLAHNANVGGRQFAEQITGYSAEPSPGARVVGLLLLVTVLATVLAVICAVVATSRSRPRTAGVDPPEAVRSLTDRAEAVRRLAELRAEDLISPEEFDREVGKLD